MTVNGEPAPWASTQVGAVPQFGELAERYRGELLVHCYRMLGSLLDAEDLVQETFLRAWRRLDTFEGRSSFRAWLYRVATNACLNALAVRRRRSLPQTTVAESLPEVAIAAASPESIWLEPFPDSLIASDSTGPEGQYDKLESVSLAFLAVLQLLTPRQRAALILRDVLDWPAVDAAEISGLSVSALNSALHRARQTMSQHYQREPLEPSPGVADAATQQLLERYVSAWHSADIDQSAHAAASGGRGDVDAALSVVVPRPGVGQSLPRSGGLSCPTDCALAVVANQGQRSPRLCRVPGDLARRRV